MGSENTKTQIREVGSGGEQREKKIQKHLVAAALPSAEYLSKESGRRGWVYGSFILNAILLFGVFCQELRTVTVRKHRSSEVQDGVCSIGSVPRNFGLRAADDPCDGRGYLQIEEGTETLSCRCHACFHGKDCSETNHNCIIDLDHGDPTMFEDFWRFNGEFTTTTIMGWQRMSYFANGEHFWFVQQELDHAIRALHNLVGNAAVDGRYVVIGSGSTQLFQAALYALSSPSRSTPTKVVSLAPYYSANPVLTDYLRSELFRWEGDAATFEQESEDDAYIELVTSPNNPDGEMRHAVVNGSGAVVHDLAYYWPQFAPISGRADHELMLFTLSKSTGHAGTRIGWAIAKDKEVANRMSKFIELNTIGVSKDSQIRATMILRSVVRGYTGAEFPLLSDPKADMDTSDGGADAVTLGRLDPRQGLFHFGQAELSYRWARLRKVVDASSRFSLPEFTPSFCSFAGEISSPTPAFAWLRCNEEDDCAQFLRANGIIARAGTSFGSTEKYVRVSMLDRRKSFDIMIDRLAALD